MLLNQEIEAARQLQHNYSTFYFPHISDKITSRVWIAKGKTNPKTEASCKVQFNLILFIIKTIFCQFDAVVCLNDGVISTYSLGRYY